MDGSLECATARFEACAQFHPSSHGLLICACGWLEDDHGELAVVRVRRHRRHQATVPARRAS